MSHIRKLAASCVLVSGVNLAGCDGVVGRAADSSNGAIAACEQAIVSTLRSPSTYKRAEAKYTEGPSLTEAEFGQYQNSHGCPFSGREESCLNANRMVIAYGVNVALAGKLGAQDFSESETINRARFTRRQIDKASKASADWSYRRFKERFAASPSTAFVMIAYDAVNAFGAPIRSEDVCAFGPASPGKAFTREDMYLPSVDGSVDS